MDSQTIIDELDPDRYQCYECYKYYSIDYMRTIRTITKKVAICLDCLTGNDHELYVKNIEERLIR